MEAGVLNRLMFAAGKKQHVAGRDMSLLISYKYLLLVQWSGRVCSCGSVVGRQSNNNIWSITSHISIGLYFRSPPPVATCPGDVINTSDQLTDSLVMYIPKGLWSIRFRLRNCSRTTNKTYRGTSGQPEFAVGTLLALFSLLTSVCGPVTCQSCDIRLLSHAPISTSEKLPL